MKNRNDILLDQWNEMMSDLDKNAEEVVQCYIFKVQLLICSYLVSSQMFHEVNFKVYLNENVFKRCNFKVGTYVHPPPLFFFKERVVNQYEYTNRLLFFA